MPLESQIEEHRAIEQELDPLAASVKQRQLDVEQFRLVRDAVVRHYGREESFLARLSEHHPPLAAKMVEQHAEALEIAARLEEALAAGQSADSLYLARRFAAIVQHNIIEEERDVFPLAERLFAKDESRDSGHEDAQSL